MLDKVMKEQLVQIIKSVVNLPKVQEEMLLNIVHIKNYNKGEHFIYAGEVPHKFGFNLQGLFRYYYLNEKGNEFTKGFFPEGAPISSYSAMIQKRESYFSIEALEDSTVALFDFDSWNLLFQKHECWKLFLIAMLEKGYCAKENRERELLLLDAEERYRSFIKSFPHVESRIKQHYIASYLGITPVALSRIKKKMKSVNLG